MDAVSSVEVPASQMSPVCFKFTNTNHHKVNAHKVKISKSFFKVKIHLKKVSLLFGRGLVVCVHLCSQNQSLSFGVIFSSELVIESQVF